MFGIGSDKTEQICGFILVLNRENEDESDFKKNCVDELNNKIESSDIEVISDINVLEDDIVTKHKSEDRYRVYIPIKYASERDPVANRKILRDKIRSIDDISIIFNKSSTIR